MRSLGACVCRAAEALVDLALCSLITGLQAQDEF